MGPRRIFRPAALPGLLSLLALLLLWTIASQVTGRPQALPAPWQVAARIERVHGPRMHVEFALRGAATLGTVQLDDGELGSGRVAFEADATHALVWHS